MVGFRYRKSIKLGGGFRINLSKSGIGYSWGVKGYRITKTAKGTTRYTASIPGTGISWVKETSKKKNLTNVNRSNQTKIENNYYAIEKIENTAASAMVSEGLEDMLQSASKALILNKAANIGIVVGLFLSFVYPLFLILLCASIVLKIYVRTKGSINLDYAIDEDQQEYIAERMEPMIKVTASNKVWRIIRSSKVINKKYTAGASNTIKRIVCKATTTPPFPFKTNTRIASFKTGKEILLFLPDKLFIIQRTKIGALNYTDLTTETHTTRFIESETVPKDASVIDHTWKYVNKSGGPDKRFKDNRQLPVCLYGEIELHSTSGLNTVIMFSNINQFHVK
jgi:RNase P subunit RPR2